MTYAEFANALAGTDLRAEAKPPGCAGELKRALAPLIEISRAFHPACRPITWRILLARTACYRATPDAILRAARYTDEQACTPFDWIGEGQSGIPPALRGRIDFAAEQASSFEADNLFLNFTLRDLAE